MLEIACFNLESCLIAQEAGADRIELCENYEPGGVTPSIKLITEARGKIKIHLHVIIRPRGGDFVYSSQEIEQMKDSILFCKEQKVDGIVFGILNKDKMVNIEVCKELIALAQPMSITFHRAIDECANFKKEINKLVVLGVDRVLTSGGKKNAEEGIPVLKELVSEFKNKIIIMPGGGIRSSNISRIKGTGAKEFHSAAILSSDNADKNEIIELKKSIG